MDWSILLNWLLGIISSISEFGTFLFTTYSMADLLTATAGLFGKVFAPAHATTIIEVLREFFSNEWTWTQNITFTPISLIGVSGLICVLVMGVIKLFDIFA